ncbi:uncharacterized protein LOC113781432 [Coffea eugenioides]|uniref:uncharacterized protein LOC113781432 n=1 Tax=Coffea eugenioides TaxID=49369 RepID=UPI000F613CD6|nr:uncharacterized protein LOC113781432 [Coffea eugenioides]
MAALQPLAAGQELSPTTKKSFSQLFSQPAKSPIQIRQASVYKGEAAVVFSRVDADRLAAPFRWTLVGKFSHERPSLEDTRKFFASLNLKDQVSIGLLDYRHALIKCTAEVDFNRIWTRGIWQLGKYPMRVFRRTREFHVHTYRESSLVPVWIVLPSLPIHYSDKHSLFSILSPVGRPLFLDSATAAGTRPSVARECVEIDVAKLVVPRVWVAVKDESGFWQRIVPENIPPYCSFCSRLGHSHEECKKNLNKVGSRHQLKQPMKMQQGPQLDGNPVVNLQPASNPAANANETAVTVAASHKARITATVDEGENLPGVTEKVAGSALQVEEGEIIVQQDCVIDDDHAAVVGEVTQTKTSDVNGYMDTSNGKDAALHGEHGVMGNQLEEHHGLQSEGTQLLMEKSLSTEHEQLADINALSIEHENLADNNASVA